MRQNTGILSLGGGGQREKAAWEVINSSDIDGGPSRYQFL